MARLILCLSVLTTLMAAPGAPAAPGADNTLLVVNADSPLSRTVANLYLQQRPLSRHHTVWLRNPPASGSITMATFREKVLEPVLQAMEERGVADDIDVIIYSADFPYRVYIEKAVRKAGLRYNKYVGIAASLSGLTWFANLVRAERADFIAPFANGYYRHELGLISAVTKIMTAEDRKKRSRVRALVRSKRYAKALNLLDPLVTAYPGYWELHLLRARALAGLGQIDAALAALAKLPEQGYRKSLALRNVKEFQPLLQKPAFQRILARMDDPRRRFEQPIAFSRRRHWSRSRLPHSQDFDRYYLAALLAYTGQRGNSLPEIRKLLARSIRADGSHPQGTVYLMENENVRTETRQPWYAITCHRLAELNRKCEILTRGQNGEDGVIPFRRNDIIGLVTGYRHLPWKRHHSSMLPGAIAEALTSYGGDFDNPSQSKLSVFLRHGASGSSGAVAEPYAIAQKFPLPLMHVYYALGYSLGEAWYQAVASPYQTILVGDPLTRPFAPKALFQTDYPPEPWRHQVEIRFQAEAAENIDHYQVWIDGLPAGTTSGDRPIQLDTTRFADGTHEFIFTAAGKPPLEQRTSRRVWLRIDNHGLSPTLATVESRVAWGNDFALHGRTRPKASVTLYQGTRRLLDTQADANGRWKAHFSSSELGLGATELQVITELNGRKAMSNPLMVEVVPPPLEAAMTLGKPPGKSGLLLELHYDEPSQDATRVLERVKRLDGRLGRYLQSDRPLRNARILGYFQVEHPGFHQLTVSGCRLRRVAINGKKRALEGAYLPLWLKRGWHRLEAEVEPDCLPHLTLVLGGNTSPLALGDARTRTGAANLP